MGKQKTAVRREKQQREAEDAQSAKREKNQERFIKSAYKKEMKRRRGQRDAQWDADFKKLSTQVALLGLCIKDVDADGNCLFSAVGDQIYGEPRRHADVRHQCMEYIVAHPDDFSPFIEDDEPFDKYIGRMRRLTEWGGNLEIQAMSMAFNVNISIHMLNAPRWDITNHPPANTRTIHLSYHDGQHYCSVRPAGDKSNTVPEPVNLSAARPVTAVFDWKAEQRREEEMEKKSVDEQVVIRATGATDLIMVRDALREHGGDVNATIDYLSTVLFQTGSYETPDATTFSPAPTTSTSTADAGEESTSAGAAATTVEEDEANAAAIAAALAEDDQDAVAVAEAAANDDAGASKPTGGADKKHGKPEKRMTNRDRKKQARLEKAAESTYFGKHPEKKAHRNPKNAELPPDVPVGDMGALAI